MPKEHPMSQVSRPFQIALVAMVLLVMVWFVALRGHGSSAEPAPSASTPSKVYTGSAPGVEGLTKDINKAHGAVATSQQNAKELQSNSAKASNEATSSTSAAPSTSTAPSSTSSTSSAGKGAAPSGKPSTSAASKSASTTQGKTAAGGSSKHASKSRQAVLQSELAQKKIVLLMFWNPKSSDDREVRSQLHDISHRDGRVAVHVALPLEVGDFGTFTQGVQILQTPTVLVINGKGQATTLAGLDDARGIQQAIGDALRGGAGTVQVPTLTAWVHGSSRSAYIGRANGLCKKPIKAVFGEGTVRNSLTSVHTFIVGLLDPFLKKIAALSPPSADRGHIDRLLSLDRQAGAKIDSAFTELRGGHALRARTLLLESEAQIDQGSQGLADYGLTACFPGQ
jgi:hypothetical protein